MLNLTNMCVIHSPRLLLFEKSNGSPYFFIFFFFFFFSVLPQEKVKQIVEDGLAFVLVFYKRNT